MTLFGNFDQNVNFIEDEIGVHISAKKHSLNFRRSQCQASGKCYIQTSGFDQKQGNSNMSRIGYAIQLVRPVMRMQSMN